MLEADYHKLLSQADKLDKAFYSQFSLDFLGGEYLSRSLLYGKAGETYYHLYLLDPTNLVYVRYTAAFWRNDDFSITIIPIKTLRGLSYSQLKRKLGWGLSDLKFYPKRCDVAALSYIANTQYVNLLSFDATDEHDWPVYTASDLYYQTNNS
jgi:hypothetical protein